MMERELATERGDPDFRQEAINAPRSIELRIKNRTNKDLKFNEEYFNSGNWLKALKPLDIPAHNESVGYAVNAFDGCLTGVSGGLRYELTTDKQLFLYIGFTNPWIGCNKIFIDIDAEKKPASWPYDQSYDDLAKSSHKEGYLIQAQNTKRIYAIHRKFQEMEFTIEAADKNM